MAGLGSWLQRTTVVLSFMFVLGMQQIGWAQDHHFETIRTRLALAVLVGAIVGSLYLLVIRRLLVRVPLEDHREAWRSVTFFHGSLFSLVLFVLPVRPLYGDFLMGAILTAGFSKLLSATYICFGSGLSNRRRFARNFVIIAITTMLVIQIVKSSLALSLGLVGALSIVRFRTAIKDPEELGFLFVNIALGLGFGANQFVLTSIGFFMVLTMFIWQTRWKAHEREGQTYFLSITLSNPDSSDLERITQHIHERCPQVQLKRLDQSRETIDVTFVADLPTKETLTQLSSSLQAQWAAASVSIVDAEGMS